MKAANSIEWKAASFAKGAISTGVVGDYLVVCREVGYGYQGTCLDVMHLTDGERVLPSVEAEDDLWTAEVFHLGDASIRTVRGQEGLVRLDILVDGEKVVPTQQWDHHHGMGPTIREFYDDSPIELCVTYEYWHDCTQDVCPFDLIMPMVSCVDFDGEPDWMDDCG